MKRSTHADAISSDSASEAKGGKSPSCQRSCVRYRGKAVVSRHSFALRKQPETIHIQHEAHDRHSEESEQDKHNKSDESAQSSGTSGTKNATFPLSTSKPKEDDLVLTDGKKPGETSSPESTPSPSKMLAYKSARKNHHSKLREAKAQASPQLLGQGSFSRVYSCRINGKNKAVKILHDHPPPETDCGMFMSKTTIMEAYVTHWVPGVVKSRGVNVCIKHERCQHAGDCSCTCSGYLETQLYMDRYQSDLDSLVPRPSKSELVDAFREILKALASLHAHYLIHGDLCLRNVLVNRKHAVLADFSNTLWTGIVYHYEDTIHQRRYAPPETLQEGGLLTTASEMWVFGALFLESMLAVLGCRFHGDLFQAELAPNFIPQLTTQSWHRCPWRMQIALLACIFGPSHWAVDVVQDEINKLIYNVQREKPALGLYQYVRYRIGDKQLDKIANQLDPIMEIAQLCMKNNPERRITAVELLKHPFFRDPTLRSFEVPTLDGKDAIDRKGGRADEHQWLYYPTSSRLEGIKEIRSLRGVVDDILFCYLTFDIYDRISPRNRTGDTLVACARIVHICVDQCPLETTIAAEKTVPGLRCKRHCLLHRFLLEELSVLERLKYRVFGLYTPKVKNGAMSNRAIRQLQNLRWSIAQQNGVDIIT